MSGLRLAINVKPTAARSTVAVARKRVPGAHLSGHEEHYIRGMLAEGPCATSLHRVDSFARPPQSIRETQRTYSAPMFEETLNSKDPIRSLIRCSGWFETSDSGSPFNKAPHAPTLAREAMAMRRDQGQAEPTLQSLSSRRSLEYQPWPHTSRQQ